MRRPLSALLFLAAAAACGTEPTATLEILLDELPEFTQEEDLQISGTVTRTPVKTTTIVVTVTRGSFSAIDTAAANGDFFIQADIDPNETNEFALTATDAQGSASAPLTITIIHDDEPPTIDAITPNPEAENVPQNQAITFTLSEPLVAPPIVNVRRMGTSVPGTTTFSADSLTVTFTPNVQLSAHAIYLLTIGGIEDLAGNGPFTASTCFITTSGTLATLAFADPNNDVYATNPPPPNTLTRADMVELHLARDGAAMSAILRYTNPRSNQLSQANNVSLWIELDLDQNASTGFTTLKDTLFRPLNASSTGMGVEYLISVPADGGGEVFQYTAFLAAGDPVATFTPDFCGVYEGFSVPLSALGNDDGAFDIVSIAFADGPGAFQNAFFLDPAPDDGRYTSTLTGPPPGVSISAPVDVGYQRSLRQRLPLSVRPLIEARRNRR